jgi:Rod binding domain-containing protein
MHDSPFKSKLFSGGRGGEAFGQLYDQHLAERMATGSGRKLADSIVKHIERRQMKHTDAPEPSNELIPANERTITHALKVRRA